jgi:hypothetical protein
MRLDLNMLLYAVLFLIILGLFLLSLLRRRKEEKRIRDEADVPGRQDAAPDQKQGDRTE